MEASKLPRARSDWEAPRLTDAALVTTILAFFLAAALLVRACGHIAESAQEDDGPGSEHEERQPV